MTRATNPCNRSDGSLPMRPRPAAKLAASTVALALALGTVPVWAFADDVQAQGAGDATQTQQAAPPDAGGQAPADGSAPAGDGQAPSAAPAPSGAPGGGADATTFDYSGSYAAEKTADGTSATSTDETISEADADRNAALVRNGGSLVIEGGTLQKSGDGTNDDACNFYGTNAILLAVGDSSTAAVSDSALSASSKGSNGIFATDGATAYASNVSVETTADNSRGLDATYGGTVIAENANITTQGDHSAATATDRGGGNVSVAGGNLNTAGSGSPLVYSTGTIEVDGASGTATGSQIAGMEGANVISIRNSQLASTQAGASGSDPVANGVIVYQSTSGDADTSSGDTARFQAVDSTLSSAIQSGSMFYLTNTRATIVLQNTELAFNSSAANLLQAEGNNSNNWGSAGSNGATVSLTGIDQTLAGNVQVDSISSANVFLMQGSVWTGATQVTENVSATQATGGSIAVNVDGTSKWVVTQDCAVAALNVAEGGSVVDAQGNPAKIVDAAGNVLVDGTSSVTVTVSGTYGTTIATTAENEVQATTIDRSGLGGAFQAADDTSASGSDATAEETSTEATGESGRTSGRGAGVWDAIVDFFQSLFS